jgi:hypothetical protein
VELKTTNSSISPKAFFPNNHLLLLLSKVALTNCSITVATITIQWRQQKFNSTESLRLFVCFYFSFSSFIIFSWWSGRNPRNDGDVLVALVEVLLWWTLSRSVCTRSVRVSRYSRSVGPSYCGHLARWPGIQVTRWPGGRASAAGWLPAGIT